MPIYTMNEYICKQLSAFPRLLCVLITINVHTFDTDRSRYSLDLTIQWKVPGVCSPAHPWRSGTSLASLGVIMYAPLLEASYALCRYCRPRVQGFYRNFQLEALACSGAKTPAVIDSTWRLPSEHLAWHSQTGCLGSVCAELKGLILCFQSQTNSRVAITGKKIDPHGDRREGRHWGVWQEVIHFVLCFTLRGLVFFSPPFIHPGPNLRKLTSEGKEKYLSWGK